MKRSDIDRMLLTDPEIRSALSNRPSLCYATDPTSGLRVASPTGNHIPSILKEAYATGLPIPPWCVWCSQSL